LKPESRPRLDLLLLGLALAVGLVVRWLFATRAPVFLEGDSQSYLLPGWDLAQGEGFSPELRRAPGYPLFIGAVLRLLGAELQALALVQHLLGLLAVGLTYLLGRRLFGRPAGLIAALLLALSGPQLIYERYLMSEALFGFVLTLAALLMVLALQPPTADQAAAHFSPATRQSEGEATAGQARAPHGPSRAGWSVGFALLAGLTLGLAALVRPVAQAVLPLFLLALVLGLPRWRPALRAVAFALVGYALIALPWTLRNLAAHDTATTAGGLGRSLIARTVKYDSLFDWKWLSETYAERPDAESRARMLLYRKRGNIPNSRSVRPYQDALIEELGLSQGEADRAMRGVALEAIARRPLDYLGGSLLFSGQLLLGREERLQSHWKQRATKDWDEQWDDRLDALVEPLSPATLAGQELAATLTELFQPARFGWLLAPLVLAGCLAAWRAPARPALLLAAVALLLAALSAFLDGPVPRYRYPLDPLLFILAAGGCVSLARAGLAARRGNQARQRSRFGDLIPAPPGGEGSG
jgi:4-amino-4-deoxy-L-arabinose transferase-like glycosyltransferase